MVFVEGSKYRTRPVREITRSAAKALGRHTEPATPQYDTTKTNTHAQISAAAG